MSTKAIREALSQLVREGQGYGPIRDKVKAALAEVEAIERACAVVVQEKALEDWSSAMSTELATGIKTIQSIAKETSK